MSAPTTYDCKDGVTALSPVRCTDWLGRIVCGDNTEVLSGFPDACIDLVVTSPPYDDLRTYGGHSWNFETLAAQLVRVLKPGGVIVWVVADATVNGSETLTSMRQAIHFKDVCGLNVLDTMIYQKSGGGAVGSNNAYWQSWEYMLVLAKGTPKTVNRIRDKKNSMAGFEVWKSDKCESVGRGTTSLTVAEYGIRENIWKYASRFWTEEKTEHPAPFPLPLASDHVTSWSNPGDVVLDPFAGSGTTLKAAKELNRQWCGIEINPEYCAIAEARLSQDVLQLETCAMRPNAPAHRRRTEDSQQP